ncbi:MAG: iron ABC transporter permease [Spirochaetes bacterium]|nr:iron ABC transporter permease [Spirochaetota bacterium]
MHLKPDTAPTKYQQYIHRKVVFLIICLCLLFFVFILSISLGAVSIPPIDVLKTLLNIEMPRQTELIIRQIRLPQTLTALVAGAGLALAGVVLQSVLNNPLGSPITLGISHAAAFGAAFSVMILGTGAMHSSAADAVRIVNHYLTTLVSFSFCILSSLLILIISRIKRGAPEVMILAGVALGSLFTAGTMFLQYFADDTQLAAMVFWTFGDTSRATWKELGIIAVTVTLSFFYFIYFSWNYNAIGSGDETAKSLGINVETVRIITMVIASFGTAVIISFLGIIGFVGLICPHIIRRIIGDDHRFLIPGTVLCGSILLITADLISRTILLPHVLPVAIITAFLGSPLFIYLLIKGYR